MPSHSYDVLARLSPRVPAAMAELAARRPPDAVPSVAVPAASVVLLRDSEIGLETYLLHRHARMPFAPSTVVFPGGRVDPADHDGLDPIRRCAIRETAEETDVVLAEVDLHPWAHWTTPEIEPRRYDTWFFVAAMPDDLEALDIFRRNRACGMVDSTGGLGCRAFGSHQADAAHHVDLDRAR